MKQGVDNVVYDTNNIDISLLKSYNTALVDEYNRFVYGSLSTLNGSYLKECSDPYVRLMYMKLKEIYDQIEENYDSIKKWFESYLNNCFNLENYLSDNARLGQIDDNVIRNYIGYKLPPLQTDDFMKYR